ncbi:MAG: hypothetical protein AB2556_11785, partial [Candidatus Thiodiazotropha sp.]
LNNIIQGATLRARCAREQAIVEAGQTHPKRIRRNNGSGRDSRAVARTIPGSPGPLSVCCSSYGTNKEYAVLAEELYYSFVDQYEFPPDYDEPLLEAGHVLGILEVLVHTKDGIFGYERLLIGDYDWLRPAATKNRESAHGCRCGLSHRNDPPEKKKCRQDGPCCGATEREAGEDEWFVVAPSRLRPAPDPIREENIDTDLSVYWVLRAATKLRSL